MPSLCSFKDGKDFPRRGVFLIARIQVKAVQLHERDIKRESIGSCMSQCGFPESRVRDKD